MIEAVWDWYMNLSLPLWVAPAFVVASSLAVVSLLIRPVKQ